MGFELGLLFGQWSRRWLFGPGGEVHAYPCYERQQTRAARPRLAGRSQFFGRIVGFNFICYGDSMMQQKCLTSCSRYAPRYDAISSKRDVREGSKSKTRTGNEPEPKRLCYITAI